MPKSFTQYDSVSMAEHFGPVLYSDEVAWQASDYLTSLESNTVLIADFEEIKAVGVHFLDVAFSALRQRISRNGDKAPLLAIKNISPEISAELQLWLAGSGPHVPALAIAETDNISLISAHPGLPPAFVAAKELTVEQEAFTSYQLADRLGIGAAQTNTKLESLRESAAVTRWKDRSASGRPRYQYRSLTENDILAAQAM